MDSLEVCFKSDVGRKRAVNEDNVLAIRLGDVYVLAIADGLGGHAAGEVASKLAIVEIEHFMRSNLLRDNLKDTLRGAVEKANTELLLASKENPSYAGMGTTLVAAVISRNRALIGWMGDSRAYVVNTQIMRVTKDHSLVQDLVDAGAIGEEEAFDHPQKNIVTHTLGLENEVAPDFKEVDMTGKILLLCSDGLTDMLRDHEIRSIIATSSTLEEGCDNLIQAANEKGGKDNISVLLARLAR